MKGRCEKRVDSFVGSPRTFSGNVVENVVLKTKRRFPLIVASLFMAVLFIVGIHSATAEGGDRSTCNSIPKPRENPCPKNQRCWKAANEAENEYRVAVSNCKKIKGFNEDLARLEKGYEDTEQAIKLNPEDKQLYKNSTTISSAKNETKRQRGFFEKFFQENINKLTHYNKVLQNCAKDCGNKELKNALKIPQPQPGSCGECFYVPLLIEQDDSGDKSFEKILNSEDGGPGWRHHAWSNARKACESKLSDAGCTWPVPCDVTDTFPAQSNENFPVQQEVLLQRLSPVAPFGEPLSTPGESLYRIIKVSFPFKCVPEPPPSLIPDPEDDDHPSSILFQERLHDAIKTRTTMRPPRPPVEPTPDGGVDEGPSIRDKARTKAKQRIRDAEATKPKPVYTQPGRPATTATTQQPPKPTATTGKPPVQPEPTPPPTGSQPKPAGTPPPTGSQPEPAGTPLSTPVSPAPAHVPCDLDMFYGCRERSKFDLQTCIDACPWKAAPCPPGTPPNSECTETEPTCVSACMDKADKIGNRCLEESGCTQDDLPGPPKM